MFSLYSFGRAWYFGVSFYFLSFVLFLVGSLLCVSGDVLIFEWVIFDLVGFSFKVMFVMDYLGVIFTSVVSIIAGSVVLYSDWYMSGEYFYERFTRLVGLFVLSMFILVYSCSLVGLLLGWDGLGLTSFVLVMYYQNHKSYGAAMLTALMNRVGDVLLLIGIGMFLVSGHWFVSEVWVKEGVLVGFLVVVGASTKSAQMPFCSWLPAAMAAPTPVSALVHSSTLVTAGIFLLVRFYSFLSCLSVVMGWLVLVSSLTMLMAGGSSCFTFDLKKIVALSTLSQLGLMGLSLGLGCWEFAYVHLIVHAVMKAVLFLCAGVLIRDFNHAQDLRVIGSLSCFRPISAGVVVVSLAGLSGVPFMAGFYSKHAIMSGIMGGSVEYFLAVVTLAGVFATSVYSVRLVSFVYFGPLVSVPMTKVGGEWGCWLVIPFGVLGFCSVVSGLLGSWWMGPFYGGVVISGDYLPLVLVFYGGFIGFGASLLGKGNVGVLSYVGLVEEWFYDMWFLSSLGAQPFVGVFGHISGELYESGDRCWLEEVGPEGGWKGVLFFAGMVRGKVSFLSGFVGRVVVGVSVFIMLVIMLSL